MSDMTLLWIGLALPAPAPVLILLALVYLGIGLKRRWAWIALALAVVCALPAMLVLTAPTKSLVKRRASIALAALQEDNVTAVKVLRCFSAPPDLPASTWLSAAIAFDATRTIDSLLNHESLAASPDALGRAAFNGNIPMMQ